MKPVAYLENHIKNENVFYPGIKSHPGHKIASEQMTG